MPANLLSLDFCRLFVVGWVPECYVLGRIGLRRTYSVVSALNAETSELLGQTMRSNT